MGSWEQVGPTWTREDAAHLLRRAAFAAEPERLEKALADGPQTTVDRLLATASESKDFEEVDASLKRLALVGRGAADLRVWWLHRFAKTANPLREKMTLFWHQHFATSAVKVPLNRLTARQNDLFRREALGDFSALAREIARDPAMLLWLDGATASAGALNENFAREVMELFLLGPGAYTESDVREAARAFAGWTIRFDEPWMDESARDTGTKRLFGKDGTFDGDAVVGLCLDQPAAAPFLANKLLRYFVTPRPPKPLTEKLASSLRQHRWRIGPALRDLFLSRDFYASEYRGQLIKGPVEWWAGTCRMLAVRPNYLAAATALDSMGQTLFEPPTVAGWEGGRAWMSASAMLARARFAAGLVDGREFGEWMPPAGAGNAEAFVSELTSRLLANPLAASVKETMVREVESAGGDPRVRARAAAFLTLTLPEYQVA